MGLYINPQGTRKETWLEAKGMQVTKGQISFAEVVKQGMVPVVLMDNGPFTAAGVCWCEGEFQAFTEPGDPRPKIFYLIDTKDLQEGVNAEIPDYIKSALNIK